MQDEPEARRKLALPGSQGQNRHVRTCRNPSEISHESRPGYAEAETLSKGLESFSDPAVNAAAFFLDSKDGDDENVSCCDEKLEVLA